MSLVPPTGTSNWPKSESGDFLFTAHVVNADGIEMLLRTSGRSLSQAIDHAYREAAEETYSVGLIEEEGDDVDDALEDAIQMAIDRTQSFRIWAGHHSSVPGTPPLAQETLG